jgi:hypothetical protein
MADHEQNTQYNDSLADVTAIVLIGTIVIGTVVYWLATI